MPTRSRLIRTRAHRRTAPSNAHVSTRALIVAALMISGCWPAELQKRGRRGAGQGGNGGADTGIGAGGFAAVVLNELGPNNQTVITDSEGRYTDWLELYNPGPMSLPLGGYRIGDGLDPSDAWMLPDGLLLQADAFLVLWATGEAREDEPLSLPFTLSDEGSLVSLWSDDNDLINAVEFPATQADQSYARLGDGGPDWTLTDRGTPGQSNIELLRAETTLLEAGSSWRYLDSGVPPESDWVHEYFDDSDWSMGAAPLGYGDEVATEVSYGDDPADKHITTWFRTSFDLDASDIARTEVLRLSLRADDGVLIWLNGAELFRLYLPDGDIEPSTPASVTVTGDGETSYFEWIAPASALLDGENTVAVEVHQTSPTSTDLGLDLEMTLEYISNPAR